MHSSNPAEPTASPAPGEITPASPLLPPLLLGRAAFPWLWILPIGILLFLNFQGYRLIEGNMNAEQRYTAHLLGLGNLALLLVGVGGWLHNWRRDRSRQRPHDTSLGWAIAALVLPVAYLWLAVAVEDQILPRNVRAWLYPETQFFSNQFSFALLPLFWGVLRLAAIRPVASLGRTFSVSLAVAIGTPVLLYLGMLSMERFKFSSLSSVIFAVLVVVMSVIMFVALARTMLLGLRHARSWGPTGERAAILCFALLFPLGGLWLNRTIPFPEDFQAWEVYALVVVNTAILLLASFRHTAWPKGSLYLLCATLPFSLYFFIVFLPYTPLSLFAVIALGAGFLVLSPILLFVLHLHLLNQARLNLPPAPDRRRVLIGGVLCSLLLPGFFIGRGLADKAALTAALDYVYAPAIETQRHDYLSSRLNLRRALANHRAYKNGISYPLLSPFYSWLVFDNLVLPDDKLATLEKTFFGEAGAPEDNDFFGQRRNGRRESSVREQSRMPRTRQLPHTVQLQELQVAVAPVDQTSSIVTLSFTLKNPEVVASEYVQALPLPAGVFVAGFRLHIDGQPVPGRITEKKTALWVYTMIRDSERRDPGLLFYNQPDELELRVFPVVHEQPSLVEIDFLVPTPAGELDEIKKLTDPVEILHQAGAYHHPLLATAGREATLLGGPTAALLPVVPREPYLHLIVDRSATTGFTGSLAEAIAALQKSYPGATRGRVTLANYALVDSVADLTPLAAFAKLDTARLNHELPLAGGFSLDRALASAIRQHRHDLDHPDTPNAVPPRPVFVVLSNADTPLPPSFTLADEWSDLLPQLEIHRFGPTGPNLPLEPGSMHTETPLLRLATSIRPLPSHGLARFPRPTGNDIVEYFDPTGAQWRPLPEITVHAGPDHWTQALSLRLAQQDYARSPGDAPRSLPELVSLSRTYSILLPCTSYIVVENSAQWRRLELSERQKLGQSSALAFRETPEPSVLLLALGLAGYAALRRIRARRESCP